ncbi:MAG: DUF6577 family protein [Anditalea sp.]
MKDSSRSELFLNPDAKAIDFYIAESTYPVIIKKLITRSPIVKRTGKKVKLYTPQLEKLLVDLFAEDKLFYFLKGSELMHIYSGLMMGERRGNLAGEDSVPFSSLPQVLPPYE